MTTRLLEPIVTCCTVVVSAFLAANLVNTLVRGAMQTTPSIVVPRATPKRVVAPSPAAAAAPGPSAATPAPPPAPPVTLLGTTTGAYPSAVLVTAAGGRQEIYRVRDGVGDGWVIAGIGVNRIVLRKGDREEVVSVTFTETKPPAPPATAAAAATATAPRTGIRLDPRDVEQSLADLNKVVTQARVMPYVVGGKVAGYTIFDIVPGSVYAKLGLQNNDVVERVNGVEIKSPEALYQLFQQIRHDRTLALDFSRNGKRETIQIEIR